MNFSALKEALRERLVEGVADRSLTGAYIAREVGISQAHIWNVLHSKREMSFELADRFLEVLGSGVEDLIAERAIAQRVPFQHRNTETFTSVPVIAATYGLRPRFQQRMCSDALLAPISLFQDHIRPNGRVHWLRAVAMSQTIGEKLVIDRYDHAPGPGTFAVCRQGRLATGALTELEGQVIFWAQGHDPAQVNSAIVIGRVVQTQTAM